jgi:maltokinase
VTDEHARGVRLLEEALECTAGPEGERLAARAVAIRTVIDGLAALDDVDVQHVHGDLHVGQLLRSATALVVNDFDGNPIAPSGERHRMRTAMADLASLIQSVDHVGRIVARRHPQHTDDVERFIAAAIERIESAYGTIRPARPGDETLLAALRVIQELHELVYAARALPRWLYVPDMALTAMFPTTGKQT